ncbi:MAG: hypothetical protein FWE22_03815 [Firmicutes bacterium]|nr:hypothetical protein [Bacillota bacterium]
MQAFLRGLAYYGNVNKIKLHNNVFLTSVESFDELVKGGEFSEDFSFLALSYNAFHDIDLNAEIDGVTGNIEKIVSLSKVKNATIFCGITSHLLSTKHISIVVAHHGKLVDIVDRTARIFNDDYSSSKKIKVYATEHSRIAVLVDKDVLSHDNWARIAPYCDSVLSILKGDDDIVLDVALSLSKKFSLPLLVMNGSSVSFSEQ